jgi:hypothetical protein
VLDPPRPIVEALIHRARHRKIMTYRQSRDVNHLPEPSSMSRNQPVQHVVDQYKRGSKWPPTGIFHWPRSSRGRYSRQRCGSVAGTAPLCRAPLDTEALLERCQLVDLGYSRPWVNFRAAGGYAGGSVVLCAVLGRVAAWWRRV